jgi:hypothetical protein
MRSVESQARVLQETELSDRCSVDLVLVAGHDGSGLETVWREGWRPARAERVEVEEPCQRSTRDEDEAWYRRVVDETEGLNHLETVVDQESESGSDSDSRR